MKFIKSKKGLALLAVIAVVAIAAVGAYAYITVGGSGTGTATAGTVTNNLVIGTGTDAADPVSVASGILPGTANAVAVSYSIYNPNPYSVVVTSVSASSIIQSNTTCNVAPLTGDFSYTDTPANFATPVTIAANTTATGFTGTLTESDDPAHNQDACTGGAPFNNSTTLNLQST